MVFGAGNSFTFFTVKLGFSVVPVGTSNNAAVSKFSSTPLVLLTKSDTLVSFTRDVLPMFLLTSLTLNEFNKSFFSTCTIFFCSSTFIGLLFT